MTDHRLRLDLPVLLPEVDDERDQCVERLQEALAHQRGIDRAHIDREEGQAVLCLHYEPNLVPLERVRRMAEDAGADISRRFKHETFHVRGMDCGDCAASLEHILGRKPGMVNVQVSYAAERMRVEFDASQLSLAEIGSSIEHMGYEFERTPKPRAWLERNWQLVLSLVSGASLLGGFLGQVVLGFPFAVSLALYLVAYAAGGLDTTRHGIAAARHLRFDIDFLMIVAAAGAAVLGRWAEGAFLLFLFSLGHALEHHAMDRARRSIRALGELVPRSARVRREGREFDLPVDALVRGDLVIVRPGERLPVDGQIRQGRSAVDQSSITGESMPVDVGPGDDVFAGSVNGEAALEVDVTRLAQDSTLSRVMKLVEQAQTQKSRSQRFTERFSRVFVPVVLGAVALAATLPPLAGWLTWSEAFLRAITLLVAASPCALAISTPSAVLSGIARAARSGVLIKGGLYLEDLGDLDTLAFDKTGTLTAGHPAVTDVVPMGDFEATDVLAAAAAVEAHSTHPLAQAVLAFAQSQGVVPGDVQGVVSVGGRGARGRLNGELIRLGNLRLFEDDGVKVPAGAVGRMAELEDEGKTATLVGRGGQILGIIALADQPRPEAAETMKRLKAAGIRRLVMVTGDNLRVANAVGADLGLTEIHAGLLPEDKVRTLRALAEGRGAVGMVGDGVNDAPAMASARIGIAMGGAGTDVALETSDVALMADDLSQLPFAVALGRAARRTIRQNLGVAMATIALLVPAALSGLATIGPAIVFHEGSTLLVVANALRLLRFRDR